MTKSFDFALALALAAALCGCATVKPLATPETIDFDGVTPVESVLVSNSGWYLLSCIPLFSGNPDEPNANGCKVFQNSVTLANQMAMLDAEAKRVGATRAIDVSTSSEEESILFFLVKHWRLHTSAVLVKEEVEKWKGGMREEASK